MSLPSTRITDALANALRPLARLLIRYGIGYAEFETIAKAVFVDTATRHFGLRDRPTNASRVAAMLGLSRREVRRIRDLGVPHSWIPELQRSPINVVVHSWLYDSDFSESPGNPRVLPYKGDTSFTELVLKYVGDLPVGAVRRELIFRGAMTVGEGDTCRLDPKFFEVSADREDIIQSIFFSIRNLIETAEYNARLFDQKLLVPNADYADIPRFERAVWTKKLDEAAIEEFRSWLSENGQNFLQDANRFIGERESYDPADFDKYPVIGVGLYFYRQDELQ